MLGERLDEINRLIKRSSNAEVPPILYRREIDLLNSKLQTLNLRSQELLQKPTTTLNAEQRRVELVELKELQSKVVGIKTTVDGEVERLRIFLDAVTQQNAKRARVLDKIQKRYNIAHEDYEIEALKARIRKDYYDSDSYWDNFDHEVNALTNRINRGPDQAEQLVEEIVKQIHHEESEAARFRPMLKQFHPLEERAADLNRRLTSKLQSLQKEATRKKPPPPEPPVRDEPLSVPVRSPEFLINRYPYNPSPNNLPDMPIKRHLSDSDKEL